MPAGGAEGEGGGGQAAHSCSTIAKRPGREGAAVKRNTVIHRFLRGSAERWSHLNAVLCVNIQLATEELL